MNNKDHHVSTIKLSEALDLLKDQSPEKIAETSRRFGRLAKKLGLLGMPSVEFNTNYSSSHLASIFYNDGCVDVDIAHSLYRVDVYISIRADYFTTATYLIDKSSSDLSFSASPSELNICIQHILSEIERFMANEGVMSIDLGILDQPANGYLTELDGKPATVFERLFSEI